MSGAVKKAAGRHEVEDLCRLRLEKAGSEYRLALARLREIVTAHAATGPGDDKAGAELEVAYTALFATREEYMLALRTFTDLIVTGKLPATVAASLLRAG